MAEPLLSVRDAEQAAAQILTADIRDFIGGGSEAEATLAANRAALDTVYLVPRVLTGITTCDTATTLVGSRSALSSRTSHRPLTVQGPAGQWDPGRRRCAQGAGAGSQRGAAGASRAVGPGQRLGRAAQVLSLLGEELTEAMHLAGCPDVASARNLRTSGAVARDGGVTAR